jgi:hypothetical protein
MVNPNEITLPKLLKQRGYQSALFGKFHLGIQGNDPYGLAMVHALGSTISTAGWMRPATPRRSTLLPAAWTSLIPGRAVLSAIRPTAARTPERATRQMAPAQ